MTSTRHFFLFFFLLHLFFSLEYQWFFEAFLNLYVLLYGFVISLLLFSLLLFWMVFLWSWYFSCPAGKLLPLVSQEDSYIMVLSLQSFNIQGRSVQARSRFCCRPVVLSNSSAFR